MGIQKVQQGATALNVSSESSSGQHATGQTQARQSSQRGAGAALGGLKDLQNLKRGDLIMEHGNMHAVMYAAGDKPLVHSTNGRFFGVLQQGPDYLTKKFGNETPKKLPVYRMKNAESPIPEEAARIGEQWALRSRESNPTKTKTPFGEGRLNDADEDKAEEWSPEATFRAARAALRSDEDMPLSKNQGVSCSQFVTYAYQAAALKKGGDASNGAPELLDHVKQAGAHQQGALKSAASKDERLQQQTELVRDAHGRATEVMPHTLQVNAKHMTADVLSSQLRKPGGDFELAGYAVPYENGDESGVKLLPKDDPRAKQKISEIGKAGDA
ncbi:hypothetical protein [Burkholderia sp. MSMB1498]|uniref:hypothetical protein n=1 Tax=Burkholderia sp. MSMB1498 TaxID=1637842 RepID=UPI000754D086|nr:hypothetical protein [Burkholderia sp. MSMB1498]KVK78515.1 hypothetical protein WS91_14690 [Burkholderia sp. MSMB1498]